MPAWLVWVIVAAVLSVVELLTVTVAAGLLAVAAVAASVTAAVGVGAAGQAAAFAVAGGVCMAVVLPAVRRRRQAARPGPRSGAAALVGRSALVIDLYFVSRKAGELFSREGPKFAMVAWQTRG